MHNIFRALLEDEANRRLYDQVPRVSARHPHLLEFELGFSTSAVGAAKELLRQSLEVAPMQKLTHKILQENFLMPLCRSHSKMPNLLGASALGARAQEQGARVMEDLFACSHGFGRRGHARAA